jgi:hypothetical protein
MIRRIDRSIADFGVVACIFCSLDGMYSCGEKFVADTLHGSA